MFNGNKENKTSAKVFTEPVILLIILTASIFSAEAFVMLILSILSPLATNKYAFLDAGILAVIAFPVMYYFVFRPFKSHIEALKRSEEALQASEAKYRAIFEQSPYGILLIDTKGRIIEFSEAAHRELGYTREEFARFHICDIDPVQSPEEIQASIRDVLKKGSAKFEVKHKTKNGEIRDVQVITQVLDLSGHKFFQTIWHDITDSKEA